ncbi:hypothetical protein [Chondromyces apiculatus]|nr:hypothetical protein [Chondromyces apiculatus]
MAKPWDINGDDIELWSQQHDASAELPDLVRQLLLATVPLSTLTTTTHAGTRLPGWDMIVRASRESAFCPQGASGWELSIEERRGKLDDDFKKRSADPSPFDPKDTTYVAVSARRISAKIRWAGEQQAKRTWKDVRLLDADDLAAWLALAPTVARWFAGKLGRPSADVEDLDTFLHTWRGRTPRPLPFKLALAGEKRLQQAETVRAWARQAGRRGRALLVHAHTRDEALVFVAAALATDVSPEGHQICARTLVVHTEEALRGALGPASGEPLIVLSNLSSTAPADRAHGALVVPLEGHLPSGSDDVLKVEPAPFMRFVEMLKKDGFSETEARRAQDSGGNLASLQRLFGHVALPRWVEGAPSVPLATMLLVGSFQPGNQEDRDVLALLGADPGEVEALCEHLALAPDAPTIKEGRYGRAVWRWRAEEDVWKFLGGRIPADTLRRFAETIRLVLGEQDPSLELPPEERLQAPFLEKIFRASDVLREGMSRALVRLALSDETLATLHGPQCGSHLASYVLQDLLQPAWSNWASLSNLLPRRFRSVTRSACIQGTT